jgi:O-succinylbenzoic acid--CoA ligase
MEGRIIFEHNSYTFTELCETELPANLSWANGIRAFVRAWLNETPSFNLQTSGSTGKPKQINLNRSQMEASARATISHLSIKNGAKALLCMNPDMVGGRMMLVRALIGQWQLFVLLPTSLPLLNEHIDFTAMVPLQVQSLIDHKEGTRFLNKVKRIIIGGAAIPDSLEQSLQQLNSEVYQTFGMTETVSHIGLRKINGHQRSEFYSLIGDNEIDTDDLGRLKIKGSVTNNEWIQTNDLVEIHGQAFKWIGRADMVVNSGGIKVHIEPLEKQLSQLLQTEVLIWKLPHPTLGEQVVAILKEEEVYKKVTSGEKKIENQIDRYQKPKIWALISTWELTASGKPDRAATLRKWQRQ